MNAWGVRDGLSEDMLVLSRCNLVYSYNLVLKHISPDVLYPPGESQGYLGFNIFQIEYVGIYQ